MPPPPANGGTPQNPGQARSPRPPKTTPDYPKSMAEYIGLKHKGEDGDKAAMARFQALKQDPDFHPEDLPAVRPRF